LLVIDEDVPGGASAYIMQQIVETKRFISFLDSKPWALTAKAHRPPYEYWWRCSLAFNEDIYEKYILWWMRQINAIPNLYTKF
jgi:hypothetical protein